MTTRNLERIVELQDVLRRLTRARRLLAGIPDWMEELHEEYSERKGEIDAVAEQAEEAASRRRLAEGEIADAQERLKKFQGQIGMVRTQREYGAILQEIDTVKQEIKDLEEQAFADMELQEELQQELAEKKEAFRDLEERYAAELERWEEEKPEIAAETEELESREEELRETIPRQVLGLFERIYERLDGEALAPVRILERGGRKTDMYHCGVCNYRVRPQAVMEIRSQGSLVQCDGCKRLLWYPEEE